MPTTIPAIEDAQTLAQAIVDTIHEPLIVLDGGLRVLAASRAFYETFKVDSGHTMGCRLYDLGDGQWNIPALRLLLETILPEKTAMDGFEVEHDFPGVGRRTVLLNARKVISRTGADGAILLAVTDITARRAVERDLAGQLEHAEELLRQKQVLLQEMQHRVANSLQIIASILMIKARAVTSEETRLHLRDAHQRVLSVAEVQSHLHASDGLDQIEVGPYLTKLCASLAASMLGDSHPISLRVEADHGLLGSDKAVSMGLIVTELVINAIKYAFPEPAQPYGATLAWPEPRGDALILVRFESAGEGWMLGVRDNGVGVDATAAPGAHGGLGGAIVEALVKQLDARMQVDSAAGMDVSIRHAMP